MAWGDDPENSILVIDDDPGICNALSRILSSRFDVSTANTILEADQLIHNNKFGIVIVDYNLRDRMDGIKFAGNSDFGVVKKALNERNIDKFMIKPFEAHDLLNTMDIARSDFSSKREIADMLQTDDGVKMAQNLLTHVFDENIAMSDHSLDLAGLVISRNSIPLFSKFFNSSYLKQFTDTIFSGFMTAIHMVGEEVFNSVNPVNIVKFGEISIYFKFYKQYQFCYIVRHHKDLSAPSQFKIFDDFYEEVVELIKQDPNYFSVNNDYMDTIEDKLYHMKELVVV